MELELGRNSRRGGGGWCRWRSWNRGIGLRGVRGPIDIAFLFDVSAWFLGLGRRNALMVIGDVSS